MVRNKRGGSGHKKQASRHAKAPEKSFKLRLPKEEEEIIACVCKINGGGTTDIICNDGKKRLCIIRQKFRGRNKRDNELTLHAIVLVGMRSYEIVAPKKKQKTDLLYIYSEDQKIQLKQGGHLNSCVLYNDVDSSSHNNKQTNNKDYYDMSNKKETNTKIPDDTWDGYFGDI